VRMVRARVISYVVGIMKRFSFCSAGGTRLCVI
jgi:hypothetical protein